jgi:transposase
MPQLQLPIFPSGTIRITPILGFEKRDGQVTYFHYAMPVFSHDEADLASFRMITSQFCISGVCKQPQIVKSFGVALSTVKRYCALYREKGPAGFYQPRKNRGAAILTAEVMAKAQQCLDRDMPVEAVAEELGIKRDTFKKAVRAGRLHVKKKTSPRRR